MQKPLEWSIRNFSGGLIDKLDDNELADNQSGDCQNVISTGKVQLVYKPRPAIMSLDLDVPELPDCEDTIIAYAIWKNYIDGEDGEEAEFWEVEYYKRREEWLELVRPKYKIKHRVRSGVYK